MKKNLISLLSAALLITLPACMGDKNNSCCNKSTACSTTTPSESAPAENPLEVAVETEKTQVQEENVNKF
ncbi:MAG: hypothetical protein NT124_02320 [Candidatus Dependentiae bacterium]|nr:hypothetical protein [Candidatus Dependentiae bacterium]